MQYVIWVTTGPGDPMAAAAMLGSMTGFDAARAGQLSRGVARRPREFEAFRQASHLPMNAKVRRTAELFHICALLWPLAVLNEKAKQSMSTRLRIISEMQRIAAEQQVTLPPLDDDLSLHETGFDSLGFAILVARLEDDLGIDPFTISEDAAFPLTIGDFIRAYENVPA
jgi:acyl carrier protein